MPLRRVVQVSPFFNRNLDRQGELAQVLCTYHRTLSGTALPTLNYRRVYIYSAGNLAYHVREVRTAVPWTAQSSHAAALERIF